MHILLTTYGLLMIMALFAFAQWKSVEAMIFTDAVATWHFKQTNEQIARKLDARAESFYKQEKKKRAPNNKTERKEPTEKKQIDKESAEFFPADDPNPSEGSETTKQGKRSHLLNVSSLFCDKNASKVEGKGKIAFQILKNLIETLYSKQPFYQKAKKEYPDLEELFIVTLMEKAKIALEKGYTFRTAKRLSKLDLEDETLNYIRYKVFTGNQSINDKEPSEQGYYPLYELISTQKGTHVVSLWLAHKPLLYAVFQNHDAVAEMRALRKDLYNERRRAKGMPKGDLKSLEGIQKQKLEQCFKSYPSGFIDSQFFDFETSTSKLPTN